MHLPSHAALGWLIGAAAPGSDRRLRAWCTAAAVIPDVEAVTYLLGASTYSQTHHTFGHNAFLGAIVTTAALWHHRDRPWSRRLLAAALVALAFCSHLVTDAALSEYSVRPLWPAHEWRIPLAPRPLGHPLNTAILVAILPTLAVLALWRNVTPLDLLSPRLDRAFVNAFRAKTLACATCARPCNERCDACSAPVCSRHARLTLRRLTCASCNPRT